ncbi:MAG: peroxiredoxin [Bdellovibrionota bacterium]
MPKKKVAKKVAKKATKKAVKKVTKAPAKTKAVTKSKAAPKAAAKAVKASRSTKTYKLKVGDQAPSFTLPANDGKSISSSTFSNRKLVLFFYPKDNTPGCTLEGQDFARLSKEFEKAGATVVGVSQDSVKSHESFRSKCGFKFDLLSDADGSLCKDFDVIQMKSMYGREFEGIERSTFVIEKGVIRNEWRKVRVEGHAQAVLDAVKA